VKNEAAGAIRQPFFNVFGIIFHFSFLINVYRRSVGEGDAVCPVEGPRLFFGEKNGAEKLRVKENFVSLARK